MLNNLDEYILELKKRIKTIPDITELELIRYVYLDLGNKISFDETFQPFGNSKTKQKIYKYHSKFKKDLNECLKNKKAICKSLSYILEYVLKSFGVDIVTKVDDSDIRKCPHVYNIIKQKNGISYVVDLQEDLYNIQSHYFTKNFAINSIREMKPIISRFEIEQIDKKLGYINSKKYYTDEYLYLLKSTFDIIDNFGEKVQFILENIDAFNLKDMGYTDIIWHHKTILEYFFNKIDFDYQESSGRIRMINCYKDVNNKRKYLSCIAVRNKGETDIYLYNKNEAKYFKLNMDTFAKVVENGLVIRNCSVPGLSRTLKKLKCHN